MAYNQSGVNLNAQRLPNNYMEADSTNPSQLVQQAAVNTRNNQALDSARRVGVVNAPNIPNNPVSDQFSKENMTNPEVLEANQQILADAQKRATRLRQAVTLVGVGLLTYFTLIRKKGFLSIRKHFMKNVNINTPDKLNTFANNLINKKAVNGFINGKEIPKKVSLSFTNTGITVDAQREAVTNLHKVAKEASLLDDFVAKIRLNYAGNSADELNLVKEKIKSGRIDEISDAALAKIEKITFEKASQPGAKVSDIIMDPLPAEVFDISKGSEAWRKFTRDTKYAIKRMFASDN